LNPIVIVIGGGALLLIVLERQHQGIATRGKLPSAPIAPIPNRPLLPSTGVGAGASDTKQALAGVSGIAGAGLAPGMTPAMAATAAYAGIAAAVSGFVLAGIDEHHQAVLNEAHNLNTAVPQFFQNIDTILKSVMAKRTDAATAKTLIDRSMQIYLEGVSTPGPQATSTNQFHGLITMGADPWKSSPFLWMQKNGFQNFFAKMIPKWIATPMKLGAGRGKPSDSVPSYIPADPTPNPCNGPCVVFRNNVLPTAYRAKLAIDQIASGQHGQLTALQTFGNKYGFAGYPEVTWRW
jgi:outer membrane murein-binding lipoprotein Lpp